MGLISTSKNCVLFKYGGVPVASNVVNIEEKVIISPDVKQTDFSELDGELANTDSFADKEHTTATFPLKAKLRGNNKAGDALDTPPAIADLLKSSGLKEKVNADNVEYTLNHSSITPSTALVYMDGKKRTVDGIVSNFKLSGTVGSPATVEFNCMGYTDIEPVNEANPIVTLDKETIIIVNKVSAVTIGGQTFNMKSFDFDLNNSNNDIYAVDIGRYERDNLDPKISLTGYEDSAATTWADFASQELKAINIVLGTGVGKTVTLTIDAARPLAPSESDDNGKLSVTKEFRCRKDEASGEHFKLKWS